MLLERSLLLAAGIFHTFFISVNCNGAQARPLDRWGKYEVGDFGPANLSISYTLAPKDKTVEDDMAERLTKRRGFLIKAATEYRLYKSKQDFISKPTSGYSILIFLKTYKYPAAGEDVLVTGYQLRENRILVSTVDVYLRDKAVTAKNKKKTVNTIP